MRLFTRKKKEVIPEISDVQIAEQKVKIKENIISSYPKEVLEIHHEFFTAADNLVKQANEIIDKAKQKDINKIKRLESLGFKQAEEVTEAKPIIKAAELSEGQLQLLKYYQFAYPLNKFITEEQVKEICFKYNLICGDVGRFKGFVPDKNLKEVENFKLKKEDDTNPEIGEFYIIMQDWSLLNVKDLPQSGYTYVQSDLDFWINYVEKSNYCFFGSSVTSPLSNIPGWGILFQYRENNIDESDIKKAIKRNQKSLQICTPVKDMDMTNMSVEDGYKMKRVYKDIPDPVVLQPVKGGYLILTAWGDEASDPIVLNEINN